MRSSSLLTNLWTWQPHRNKWKRKNCKYACNGCLNPPLRRCRLQTEAFKIDLIWGLLLLCLYLYKMNIKSRLTNNWDFCRILQFLGLKMQPPRCSCFLLPHVSTLPVIMATMCRTWKLWHRPLVELWTFNTTTNTLLLI